MKPIIKMKDVTKRFGDHHALRKVNFEISEGEIVVLCGPSGSGKSTLIRCLNQLEVHQEGEIFVYDEKLTDDPKLIQKVRSEVGMVFQHFNLFPHLTVLENLTLGPIKVKNKSPEWAKEKALHFLKRVKIEEQAHKYPEQLSGGQKQRVAIARTLCMGCKIILFDEPTSALDPEMVQEILDIMILLTQEQITMIVVTHEMGFAKQVANRIVFMDEGHIIEENTPEEFFKNPKSERLQNFLKQIL